jgi:hypothetical protein
MNADLLQAATAAGFIAMWVRIEHRLTKLETHCTLTHLHTRAIQSTDPAGIVRSAAEVARLEKQRGKLQNKI